MKSGAVNGARHREESSRLEGRRLRDHVLRAGRVVLDVGLWVKQVCGTPTEEDRSATWHPDAASDNTSSGSVGPDDEQQPSSYRRDAVCDAPVSPRLPGLAYKVPFGVHVNRGGGGQPRTPRSVAASASASARFRANQTTPQKNGFIGIEVSTDRYSGIEGLKVVRVSGGSPAAEGGVRAGDYLRRINDVAVHSRGGLREALSVAKGKALYVDVFRPTSTIVRLCIVPGKVEAGGAGGKNEPPRSNRDKRSACAGSTSATPRAAKSSRYVYVPQPSSQRSASGNRRRGASSGVRKLTSP